MFQAQRAPESATDRDLKIDMRLMLRKKIDISFDHKITDQGRWDPTLPEDNDANTFSLFQHYQPEHIGRYWP